MGLDNGICVQRNEKSMKAYNKLKRFDDDWNKKYNLDFEIAYWRKCWNIRHIILECLVVNEDSCEALINRKDIPAIIMALKSLNAENWEYYGSSIWSWGEQKPFIRKYIKNLQYLYKIMDKYDLDVYFYDSY